MDPCMLHAQFHQIPSKGMHAPSIWKIAASSNKNGRYLWPLLCMIFTGRHVFSRETSILKIKAVAFGAILHSMKVLWKIKKSKNRVYIRYIEGPTRMALDEGFIKRWKKSVSIPGRNVHPSNILTLSQFRETKGKRWLLWVFLFCLERIRFQGSLAGPKEINRSRARSHYGPQRTRPAGHVYTQRREELNYETKEVEN